MNGFKLTLLSFIFLISACVRHTKEAKDGDALYLLYKTPFRFSKTIGFWLSPEDFLPDILPSDKLFIENLSPDTLIFQINRTAYLRQVSYRGGGKELNIDLITRTRGNAVSVDGHLIFVRRSEADRVSIVIDSAPNLVTNLPPRK